MSEIDYTKYTLSELNDALAHIDKETYPERVQTLLSEIKKRRENSDININNAKEKTAGIEHKEKSYFEKFKLTDSASCEKAINNAFFASLILTIFTGSLTTLAMFNVRFILNEGHSIFSYLDFILLAILTYKIYVKGRYAPWILLSYLVITKIYQWTKYDMSNFGLLEIVLFYFIYKGCLATHLYFKLNPIIQESFSYDDRKTCPECGYLNHKANLRCECGYEFST